MRAITLFLVVGALCASCCTTQSLPYQPIYIMAEESPLDGEKPMIAEAETTAP